MFSDIKTSHASNVLNRCIKFASFACSFIQLHCASATHALMQTWEDAQQAAWEQWMNARALAGGKWEDAKRNADAYWKETKGSLSDCHMEEDCEL